uniref:Secreted protein n=1 Tax=Romanomermis culicivorax TaxID=13658 RepID=A0A915HKU8_ROMCU
MSLTTIHSCTAFFTCHCAAFGELLPSEIWLALSDAWSTTASLAAGGCCCCFGLSPFDDGGDDDEQDAGGDCGPFIGDTAN